MVPTRKSKRRLKHSNTDAITAWKRSRRVNIAGLSNHKIARMILGVFITKATLQYQCHLGTRMVVLWNASALGNMVKREFGSTINLAQIRDFQRARHLSPLKLLEITFSDLFYSPCHCR